MSRFVSAESLSKIFCTTDQLRKDLGSGPVSLETVRNPEVYDQERKKIFNRVWLKIAVLAEMPHPGDYVIKNMAFADTSIIAIRQKDGTVKAFHNICSHRCNKIVPETDANLCCGHLAGKYLTCRFHGWVFDIEGNLKSVPLQEQFCGLNKEELSLKSVSCDVWQGFVFVNLAANPEQSLVEYLGDFAKLYQGYPFEESTTYYRYGAVLDCNWKIALFAFSEGYHVPTIHAGSLPGFKGIEYLNPKLMGIHASIAMHGKGMDTADSTKVFAACLTKSERHRPALGELPPAVNVDRRGDFQFELPAIFPNLIIHLAAGCGYPGLTYFTHEFWPLSHGRTYWQGTNYFRSPANIAEMAAQKHVNALHRNAWLEDTATMEDTFKGVMSGKYKDMQLNDAEFLIRKELSVQQSFLDN